MPEETPVNSGGNRIEASASSQENNQFVQMVSLFQIKFLPKLIIQITAKKYDEVHIQYYRDSQF